MANEISTAGILLKYKAFAGDFPSTTPSGFTIIPNIKAIPEFNPEPSTLDVTDLSDTEWMRYIPGLKDPGGALAFTANFTSAFKTAWEAVVSAYETAQSQTPVQNMWFEVMVPNFGSFYFAGMPSELGLPASEVDAVFEGDVYITPNLIHGWDTSSTGSA